MPSTRCSTAVHQAWEQVDRILLDACQQATTLRRLIETTGLPGDLVKTLLHTHEQAGLVTRLLPGSDRYRLTLTGRAHLTSMQLTQPAAIIQAA